MAKRHVIVGLVFYLLAFAVTLRIFLNGHHVEALLILIAVWIVIAIWIWLAGGAR